MGDKRVLQVIEVSKALPRRAGSLIGFGPVSVLPGARAKLEQRLQVAYRIERLLVAKEIASSFEICDLRIGLNSLWVSGDSVPALLFATPDGFELEAPMAEAGTSITLTVRNIAEEMVMFAGGASGAVRFG